MNSSIEVSHLRTEYMTNPLGIDVARPRLSWQLHSDRRGARQTAYRILAAATEDSLVETGQDVLWDSGKVPSDQSAHIEYAGPPLRSAQRVWWKVRVWDEYDQPSPWSAPAWWEMGLLERAEWQGKWIGGPLVGGPHTSSPCPFLRKSFTLTQPVVSARLYVTALGLYECYLNGRRVGEDLFTPGWTDYKKRVQYKVYDVTNMLAPGENALGAILGDGWYCGNVAWYGRQQYGDRPRLLAQLCLTLADSSAITVATDESWKVSYGPILESDILMGESYDARLEMPGWDAPGFDDASWLPAIVFDDPAIRLVATNGPTVRRMQELCPVKEPLRIGSWPRPKWIYDLGQNMVGRVRLKVSGPRGTTITIRHGEMLNPDGSLYTENLRSARATDHYTLKGEGIEIYEPRFTFHGFRYVEISGFPGRPPRDLVTGVVIHSDTPPAGTFECSNPLVNRLQHNIVWGQKGNFVDIPTDCPQRDERLGWTGDAQVFIRTATFNMDVAAFFTRWQHDLADAQYPSGAIPPVAPNVLSSDHKEEFPGGPAWEDAFIICPWTIYLCYGDKRLLEVHYQALTRFVDYLVRRHKTLASDAQSEYPAELGFGDWLAQDGSTDRRGATPRELIGTAFLAHSTRLMARTAAILGRTGDAEKYTRLYQEARRTFIHRYVTPAGLVIGQTQTAYVLALHFDLLPDELRPAVVEALVRDIEKRDMHLSTGFVGTPYLPHVLTNAGRPEIAYALLMQKTCPSWLYPVLQGATTIWERWDGWTREKGFQNPGMNSFNHYAYGSIGAWLYTTVAGIDADPEQPGYKHIIMRPRPGGGLTYARAEYESLYGRIVSEWHIDRQRFDWLVVIPPNTTATLYIPAGALARITEGDRPAHQAEGVRELRRESDISVYTVSSGSYHFVAEPVNVAVYRRRRRVADR